MINRRLALRAPLAAAIAIAVLLPTGDALARAFADTARKHLAQPFVINNKPGASGMIGWRDVVNSKPDGY